MEDLDEVPAIPSLLLPQPSISSYKSILHLEKVSIFKNLPFTAGLKSLTKN